MLHLHTDLRQRQLKGHAPFHTGEYDEWAQTFCLSSVRAFILLLLYHHFSSALNPLNPAQPPFPHLDCHLHSLFLGYLSSSLFLCSEVPAWVSDVGETLGTSWCHPIHLVQLPDPSVPPALLGGLLTTISTAPGSWWQAVTFITSPTRLSLTPSTSQLGSPQTHPARVPQELTLSL